MSTIVKILILNNFYHMHESFHQSIYFCVSHFVKTLVEGASYDGTPQDFAQSLSTLMSCIFMVSKNI
jgi:hypothetical protein